MENKYRKNIAFFHHVKNAINKTVLLKCIECNKSAYYIPTNYGSFAVHCCMLKSFQCFLDEFYVIFFIARYRMEQK